METQSEAPSMKNNYSKLITKSRRYEITKKQGWMNLEKYFNIQTRYCFVAVHGLKLEIGK